MSVKRSESLRGKSALHLWLLEHFGRRTCGLGKPISEDPHYIVRVFYGGYWCEESLEGPFATEEEAADMLRDRWAEGFGAIAYRCTNMRISPAKPMETA